MKRGVIIALSLACVVFLFSPVLSGPGSSPPAPAAPGAMAKANPEEGKTQGLTGPYDYNAKGRRDPFTPLIKKTEQENKRILTPIERYTTDEVKLVAVLWTGKGYYAVVTLPDGKSYTLREGTKLGPHGGKVLRISRDSMVIREQIKDYRGTVSPKDTTLKLRREEEG
ncbi:MAG: pilus assembly protein PilP [Alphaproteobacteria bacterium]|uniref:Pilus assembly protein PilP n=1 Tax=Candidatus Nitrobium versatile TaxID=2884831 RepID=A0A953LXR7_9BACT|nr:pilus assembly protein PilP [Candidatus Nitrobium versatile]